MPLLYIPVEPGTMVYKVNTGCCNYCYRVSQKEAEKVKQMTGRIYCGTTAICHTMEAKPGYFTFELNNIPEVLKDWGITIFATEEEAKKATAALCAEHRKALEEFGIEFDDKGIIKSVKGEGKHEV